MQKSCDKKTQKPNTICNPLTGRWIKIGGDVHNKLIATGHVSFSVQRRSQNVEPIKHQSSSLSKPKPKPKTKGTIKTKSIRKAPDVSATTLPIGTEMRGSTGEWYVVTLRPKNNTQYWAQCSFKTSKCQNK